MNEIISAAALSCYMDVAAFLVMFLLLVFSERLRRRKNTSLRIFYLLSLSITATCVLSFICHAMYRHTAPWAHTLALISRTLWEFLAFLIVLLWVAYVSNELYGGRNRRTIWSKILMIPFVVFTVLLVVNLFNGMIFTYTAENTIEPTLIYYVFIVIETVYFIASVILVRYYDRKTMKARFFRVTPMVVSVELGVAVQFFLPYQMDVLGFSIGAMLLYFSMVSEFRFIDEESGLYNRAYQAYLFDMALAGKNDPNSALILETEGNLSSCCEILRNTLHQEGDVIRSDENRFLMFSRTDSRMALHYQTILLDEAVEAYNEAHPEEKVQITMRSRTRMEQEDAVSFMRTVMENKEAGDTMRGVVSMMSELDRLDQELALAADIQVNMLPTGFPAFPDRAEFDLYASMTPAKEVGGDFYDFFLVDDDHLAMVIADVSGKGIPAALFMMVSKTLIKNNLMNGSDPASALENVNLQLCERNPSMMFVTVWLAVLEISSGKGMACNAGHENPVLRRAGGLFEVQKYKHGVFIGFNKKAVFRNREFELHSGDCLFVYTDGVPEASNGSSEQFGEVRMTDALNRNPDAAPEELIGSMHRSIRRFVNNAPQFDDITMLCLKYYGASALQELKEELYIEQTAGSFT